MGFETRYDSEIDPDGESWNHPYGIWNRPVSCCLLLMCHHETIPMGFETEMQCFSHSISSRSWNHPYGIWNRLYRPPLPCSCRIMKPSLWDLKLVKNGKLEKLEGSWNHPYGIWNEYQSFDSDTGGLSWNHPYGIWNQWVHESTWKRSKSWNHPYGIWNPL